MTRSRGSACPCTARLGLARPTPWKAAPASRRAKWSHNEDDPTDLRNQEEFRGNYHYTILCLYLYFSGYYSRNLQREIK